MLKRFFSMTILVLLGLSLTIAQEPLDKLPVDPDTRIGTLDNGAQYYIRANKKDPQRANFHIVYKVGAAQENDNQNGLAHFLEHMAFNGSKNFPKPSMIDYLQTLGIRFGENLNAGTAQQFTTYMITNVPITREGIVDSLLLALHDWAGFISLEDKAIDEERKIISEEWRQIGSAQWRAMEKTLPVMFGNSILAKRNVIGNETVLNAFSYQDLKDFYHKWYTPDNQAFIIVGDFDPDKMVEKLKAQMADVKPAETKTTKEKITLEYNETPLVEVITDPELVRNNIGVTIRHKGLANKYNNTYMYEKGNIIDAYYANIINERLTDLTMKNNPPFIQASASHGGFGDMFGYQVDGYNATKASVTAKDGDMLPAFESLLTELYRANRGGFTTAEFERAKAKLQAGVESKYKNRNDLRNGNFVDSYEKNFLFNTPIYSVEQEYQIDKKLLEEVTLDELNTSAAAWMADRGWVVVATMPEKEGNPAPSKEDVLKVIEKVKASEIAPMVDEAFNKPLISTTLKGSPVAKTEVGEHNTTIWTLKNGVKVIFRPSDLKADEVLLNSAQLGGLSTVENLGLLFSADFFSSIMKSSGVGEFSATELSKMLAGKIASANKSLGKSSQGYSGSCAPKDLETMFQLIYLNATAPRFDTTAYTALMTQINTMLPNLKTNPDFILQDSLSKILYGHSPRVMSMTEEDMKLVTLENIKKLNNKLFSSAKDMEFFITGNISADTLRPLVEKYLGSLPIGKETPKRGSLYEVPVKGVVKEEFRTPMTSPKVTAVVIYSGDWKYSPENNIALDMLNSILEIRYTKSIREEAGGTYGVMTQLEENSVTGKYQQIAMFNTDESKINELLPLIYKEIDDLMENGPSQEVLDKVKENYKKKFSESVTSNNFWMGTIVNLYFWNQDNYTNYVKNVDSMDINTIRDMAKAVYGQGNICTVVQLPSEQEQKSE